MGDLQSDATGRGSHEEGQLRPRGDLGSAGQLATELVHGDGRHGAEHELLALEYAFVVEVADVDALVDLDGHAHALLAQIGA